MSKYNFADSFAKSAREWGLNTNHVIRAAIGLICVFCGVTNCPISSIFLSIEIFGAEGMLYFAVACFPANL